MFHRKSMIRSAGLLILALAVALSLSGCGRNNNESGPDSLLNASSGSEKTEISSVEKEGVSFEAELSYANNDYIETGNESEDKLIRNVKKTLSAMDSDEKLQVEAVVEALKTVPKGLSDAETYVSDEITINSMKFSGSTLIIDLSSDGLDGLGMYDEKFFIYQVTDSILNTFPDLEGVRFTVDGTKKDSLNYIDISSPFTVSDVKAFLNGSSDDSEEEKESTSAKASQEKTAKEEDSENEDSQKTNSDSSKSSSQTNSSSSSSGSSSSGSQTSDAKKNTSSGNTSNSSSGSKNNGSSGSQSSTSGNSSSENNSTSGNQSSSSGSSSSSSKNTGSSGSQSSSSGSSSSGSKSSGTSGSQSSSSGSSSSGSKSSGTSGTSSSGSSSTSTQDGVVNDDDL